MIVDGLPSFFYDRLLLNRLIKFLTAAWEFLSHLRSLELSDLSNEVSLLKLLARPSTLHPCPFSIRMKTMVLHTSLHVPTVLSTALLLLFFLRSKDGYCLCVPTFFERNNVPIALIVCFEDDKPVSLKVH